MYILVLDNELAGCVYTINKQNCQQISKQTKVIQEVVSLEEFKLNHSVINKKQAEQIQFSPHKKTSDKGKWIHHFCKPIIPIDG